MTKEQIQEKITQLEKELNSLKEEINKPEPTNKRWRAEKWDRYYFAKNYGTVCEGIEDNESIDDGRYNIGNYFQTRKEAEEYHRKLLFKQKYKDYCLKHGEKIDWKNDAQNKYSCYYDVSNDVIDFEMTLELKNEGATYASSEQIIKDFIEFIGEDNFKKYILEVEEI